MLASHPKAADPPQKRAGLQDAAELLRLRRPDQVGQHIGAVSRYQDGQRRPESGGLRQRHGGTSQKNLPSPFSRASEL